MSYLFQQSPVVRLTSIRAISLEQVANICSLGPHKLITPNGPIEEYEPLVPTISTLANIHLFEDNQVLGLHLELINLGMPPPLLSFTVCNISSTIESDFGWPTLTNDIRLIVTKPLGMVALWSRNQRIQSPI
jgi:hypothetical protein